MKIAVLSDAHGNEKFFEKIFTDLLKEHPEKIVYLGDVFGYMPSGKCILGQLRKYNTVILKGNHEAMMLGERYLDPDKDKIYNLAKEYNELDIENKSFLKRLVSSYEYTIHGKKMLFIHGSILDPVAGYLYENDSNYLWDEEIYDYIFMGHTHRPYIKESKNTIFCNVGSCGLPRDVGNLPSYALLDTHTWKLKIIRIKMDEDVIEALISSNVNKAVLDVIMRGEEK